MATDLESGGLPSPMTTQSSSRTRAKLKPKGLDPISKKGYGKVAWLMARSDTSDLAIFRKFGELNLLNLMSLQAELMSLQAVLRNQYERDENKGFKYSFLDLRKNTNESFEEDMEERLADQERLDVIESDDEDFMPSPIYDTLRRIRKKLKAYSMYSIMYIYLIIKELTLKNRRSPDATFAT
jgi:hypothetical protein